MTAWALRARDLKHYPHFDQVLKLAEANSLVTDPVRVAQNSFFPLLRYSKTWQPFRHKPEKSGKPRPKAKERPIRYAARRDAYIFAYYRHLLSLHYEAELTRLGIGGCPIAYRRIPTPSDARRGKCNIHFAREAFDRVRELGDCCVAAVDISSYFESIDHERLKALWCRLLGVEKLPADHFAVFKNVTSYRFVEREELYTRLGFYGKKTTTKSGKPIMGYLVPFEDVPTQLCSPQDFRQKVLGENGLYPSLVQKNPHSYGIPQGAPISDLLANLYLLDFDVEMNNLAVGFGGTYLRYSDDILLILPVSAPDAVAIMESLPARIMQHGDKLLIKPEKSSLVQYRVQGDRQAAELLAGKQGKHGLEYLGFRYDGESVYLRDSTVSSLYRKVACAARGYADSTVKRYPGKGYTELCGMFNFEEFMKKFGRVEDFEPTSAKNKWTFWTYVSRSTSEFGPRGKTITAQVRRLRRVAKHRVKMELPFALERRVKSGKAPSTGGSLASSPELPNLT